jgi:hypothetical protein
VLLPYLEGKRENKHYNELFKKELKQELWPAAPPPLLHI